MLNGFRIVLYYNVKYDYIITDMLGKIYTPNELSKILNIGYRSILKLLIEGSIKSFKVNNQYRIREQDLETYIERQSVNEN
tara:strand:+ start:449 stop:691 length:243 start_codon:yes stop_codon:yes gene_type:complete